MAVWPATLPAPALNTLKEAPPKGTIRTEMDKGPAVVRRRSAANPRPLSFTLRLTPAQTQALDDFFVTTTAYGADEFSYTHPRTGDSVTARFTAEPEYSEAEGVIYNVGVQLEILP